MDLLALVPAAVLAAAVLAATVLAAAVLAAAAVVVGASGACGGGMRPCMRSVKDGSDGGGNSGGMRAALHVAAARLLSSRAADPAHDTIICRSMGGMLPSSFAEAPAAFAAALPSESSSTSSADAARLVDATAIQTGILEPSPRA